MELNAVKMLIYMEEMERHGVARAPEQGVTQVGPILMRYGTREQQDYYLPRSLAGEFIWCQGYSEPNAGSDLANLQTSAVVEGDELVINGQKIWTSLANDATHAYVLCRTDASAKKQRDISFIIVDLKTPGITVKPIRDIAGNEEFCQVFFDDVFVGAPEDHGGELSLAPGVRRVELRARGYKTLAFDAEIVSGTSITYRGVLEEETPRATTPPPAAPARTWSTEAIAPTTIYVVPGCYLGNVAPKANDLKPGCDIRALIKRAP